MNDLSMPTVTILTATYNREKTLKRLFDVLQSQTLFDFEWLVINDGSTDGTAKLLEHFQSNHFNIRIYNQENKGINQTINCGVILAKGDLIFRVDSDDYITNDSVEQIIKYKDRIWDDDKLCALVFLSEYKSGGIVGFHPFKCDFVTNFTDYRFKYHGKGDRAEVVKKSVYTQYPIPKFSNEKFCHESVMWDKMADSYNALYLNIPIYVREYGVDSITASQLEINLLNPIGTTERFASILNRTKNFKYQLWYSVQYFRWIYKAKYKLIDGIIKVPMYSFLIGFVPGFLLHSIDLINPYLISSVKRYAINLTHK